MKLIQCLFVTDLHGKTAKYEKLLDLIKAEKPSAVFIGGDLTPLQSISPKPGSDNFISGYMIKQFAALKEYLGDDYPRIFLIMGNDDARRDEKALLDAAQDGLWEYLHGVKTEFDERPVYGYAYVPPTPFRLKDWERYDVSGYIDPGCISPEMGIHTVPADKNELKYSTIKKDLEKLAGNDDLQNAIFLFHSPPYNCKLDRAALDGRHIDHVPLDVHIGSIAIKEFIEKRQPLLTLHGHVHESARLTGSWLEKIGRTYAFSAAHDGPELAVIKFDPENPAAAVRKLI